MTETSKPDPAIDALRSAVEELRRVVVASPSQQAPAVQTEPAPASPPASPPAARADGGAAATGEAAVPAAAGTAEELVREAAPKPAQQRPAEAVNAPAAVRVVASPSLAADAPAADVKAARPRRSFGRRIFVRSGVVVVLALAGAIYWRVSSHPMPEASGRAAAPSPDAAPALSRLSDIRRAWQQLTAGTPAPAAVAPQRAVLLEENFADPAGSNRIAGSVVWRTEPAPSSAGQTGGSVLKADIEIPERNMTVALSIRRNMDGTLPASHLIEINFSAPAGAVSGGGIATMSGLQMAQQVEQIAGSPLVGRAATVTAGSFLVGLSSDDTAMQRNLKLLKERPVFDVLIVYANGTRAILAMEKGTTGEHAFDTALAERAQ
jgi:hypothetical protein